MRLIWAVAIFMAGSAVLAFAAIVVRRAALTALEPLKDRVRRRRIRRLLALIEEHHDAAPDTVSLPGRERRRLEAVGLDLVDELAGDDRRRLIAFLMATGTMTRAISGLDSRDVAVRRQSAALVGLFRDRRATGALWTALGDPDISVRLSAASALLASEADVDLGEVMDAMDRDGALSQADALFFGGQDVEGGDAGEVLGNDARLRLFGLQLFGRNEGRIADATLVRELRDSDADVRVAALNAIPDGASMALREAVVEALDDQDRRVRLAAIGTVGRLRVASARSWLDQGRDSMDDGVSQAALLALRRVDAGGEKR